MTEKLKTCRVTRVRNNAEALTPEVILDFNRPLTDKEVQSLQEVLDDWIRSTGRDERDRGTPAL